MWRPAPVDEGEGDLPDRDPGQQVSAPPTPRPPADSFRPDADQSPAATRITLRPHDPGTGRATERTEVVKGYEYGRAQFVIFTAEELKALDVESSKVIDLEKFVPAGEIDPVYFDSPYYAYPDGPIAVEALRVIDAAMVEAGVVGLGRLTLSQRERMAMVEPRGSGMALFTLRAAAEVRAPQFGSAEGDLDAEMVAIAGAIIRQRTGNFDPSMFRDRYQEVLQQLIEAKMKGRTLKPAAVSKLSPVIDLMAALKRSLAREQPGAARPAQTGKQTDTRAAPDRRQAAMLLPLSGQRKQEEAAVEPGTIVGQRRRKS